MLAVRLKNVLTIILTYNMHHGVLCLVRVYALYGQSCRILGLLVFLSVGSIVTSLVGRFPLTPRLVYACLNIISLSIKVSLYLIRNAGAGVKSIQVISTFGGCAQYTPRIWYVAEPACDSSSSMIRLITLVIEVNVSHKIAVYSVTSNSRNQSPLSHGLALRSLTALYSSSHCTKLSLSGDT